VDLNLLAGVIASPDPFLRDQNCRRVPIRPSCSKPYFSISVSYSAFRLRPLLSTQAVPLKESRNEGKKKNEGGQANRSAPFANRECPKPEVVWSHADFGSELKRARRIGPKKMSNDDLVSFCHGANGYYHAHFWADARPFFLELWRRIDAGKLNMSKTAACQKIGCTRQWANAIVSGRADKRRENREKAKAAEGENLVSAAEPRTALLTDKEYVREILEHAFAKLTPLLPSHWDRYRKICEELARQFGEASKTQPAATAQGEGAR